MKVLSGFLATMLLGAVSAYAAETSGEAKTEEKPVELKVGDKAPDFDLPVAEADKDKKDAPKKLSDYKGKKNVLLAFYPKAFTGGCTKQMCNYRDQWQTLVDEDTEVIAISGDEQADSDKFRAEHNMPFAVVGDSAQKIINAYGVPVKDSNGFPIAQRSTFLIDKEGVIRWIEMKYSVDEGWKPTLDELAKLKDPAKPVSSESIKPKKDE